MPVMQFPAAWTALSSSAALAVIAPRLSRGTLSPLARARIVWELEKYAPAYVERAGAEILAAAEAFVRQQLGDRAEPAEMLAVGLQHGSRVVSARGRRGQEHALAMAARAAVSSQALYDPTAEWLLAIRLRSKGMAAVDGPFGTIEVASDDTQLCGDDMKRLLASVPDQGRMNERIRGWVGAPYPPDPRLEHAFAYVCAAAVAADSADAAQLLSHNATLVAASLAVSFPAVARAAALAICAEESAAFLASARADDRVLVRLFEDRVAVLATLPRAHGEQILQAVNGLAQLAPLTPVRRELVTVTMSVLALGKAAAWRARALPTA